MTSGKSSLACRIPSPSASNLLSHLLTAPTASPAQPKLRLGWASVLQAIHVRGSHWKSSRWQDTLRWCFSSVTQNAPGHVRELSWSLRHRFPGGWILQVSIFPCPLYSQTTHTYPLCLPRCSWLGNPFCTFITVSVFILEMYILSRVTSLKRKDCAYSETHRTESKQDHLGTSVKQASVSPHF